MKRRLLRMVLSLLAILAVLYVVGALLSNKAPQHTFYQGDVPRPMVIAHQGGDGLWPGDTLFAYERAVELGVDMIEMDIHMTSDGVLVLMHDATVDRTTNGSGAISDMSFNDLRLLDAGYDWTPDDGATYPYRGQGISVSSLEEIFTAFPDMRMNIEIKQKQPSIAVPFCRMIRDYDMQTKVLVGSFPQEAMDEFRQTCPEVATSGAEDEMRTFVIMSLAFVGRWFSPRFEAVQVPERRSGIHILVSRFVRSAHERQLWLDAWTINESDDMQRLIDLGVDGIITDRPDRLLQLLGRS